MKLLVFRYSYRVLICLGAIVTCIILLYWIAKLHLAQHGMHVPKSIEGLLVGEKQLEFITDVSTFFGVVLGIAIPFGIDIVQTVSKNFSNSKVLRQRFRDEWQMVWLVPFYIATVLTAITTRLFLDPSHPDLVRAVTFTLLICLFIGFAIFNVYIKRLYFYSLEQESLKTEYKNDLGNTVGTNKKKYQSYVEGFGDIAITEVRNNDLQTIRDDSLPFLEKLAEKIVPPGDLEEAEKFLLADEFWELYDKGEQARPENEDESDSDLLSKTINYEDEAKARLAFYPDKYAVTYTKTLQQLERIYRAAIAEKNSEITKETACSYVRILKYLTSIAGRGFYAELLLQKMTSLLEEAIFRDDISKYSIASDWYTTVVFDRFGDKDRRFRLEYLNDPMDRYLYRNLTYLVSHDQKELFMVFIGRLVDGALGTLYLSKLWDLADLPLRTQSRKPETYDEIRNLVQELQNGREQVRTIKDLEEWLAKLAQIKNLVVSCLVKNEDKKTAENYYQKTALDAEDIFKTRNMVGQLFSVCVFCMFKQKYDYVKDMLDYKQPSDSDAHWGGGDVQPEKPNEVIAFYYRRGFYEGDRHFFEGHHGSASYATEYFLVLLLTSLKKFPSESISIGNLVSPNRLSDIVFRTDALVNSASQSLKANAELMKVFNFSESDIENKLIPALKTIKEQAEAKLSALEQSGDMDDEKIVKFRQEVLNSYSRNTTVRPLFSYFKKLAFPKDLPKKDKEVRFGLSQIDDKAAFFKEWNVAYADWGSQYGTNIAWSENKYLYEQLKSFGHAASNINEVLDIVNTGSSVLLAPTRGVFRYEGMKDFVPRWDVKADELPEFRDMNGFSGYFKHQKVKVPIFEIGYLSDKLDEILVVDMEAIGALKSFDPSGPENSSQDILENLAIRVDAFSSNERLLNEYLANPPDWLKEKGDASKQKEYLLVKVLIRVYERFRLVRSKKISVYLIKNTES